MTRVDRRFLVGRAQSERSEPPSSRCKSVCMHVHMCKHVFMWPYGCAYASLSTRGDGRHKRDLSSHLLTLGSVRPTRHSVRFLFRGGGGASRGRVEPTPLFFFCVSLSSPHPSPLPLFFLAFSFAPWKTEEELFFFCARKHRLRACVLFCCLSFFTK